jgi:uncharacterized protein (DUF302 family)
MEIGLQKELKLSFDDALYRVPAVLKEEGFGILTEIDMQETLLLKLGVPFRRYRILGACNPALAKEALEKNLAVGIAIPCNVVLYEELDHTVVVAVDPTQTPVAQVSPELKQFAQSVRERLVRVVEKL